MHSALNARIGRTLPAPVSGVVEARRQRAAKSIGAGRWWARRTPAVLGTFLVGALLVAGALLLAGHRAGFVADEPSKPPERVAPLAWPTHFRDRPLTPLPPGELEEFFARRFDGPIARFTDGQHVVIVRHAARPTRQLHSAEAGFRAMGYRTEQRRVASDRGEHWACFIAEREGLRLDACERVHDGSDGEWTDFSAWFWASQYGGGPWWAVTVLSPATRDS